MSVYGGSTKYPTKDTIIAQAYPTWNFGDWIVSGVHLLQTASQTGTNVGRVLLEWDISDLAAILSGNTLNSAKVYLYWVDNNGGNPSGRQINFVRSVRTGAGWTENNLSGSAGVCNWTVAVTGTNWGTAGCANTSTDISTSEGGNVVLSGSAGQWIELDVQTIVQYCIDNNLTELAIRLADNVENNATAVGPRFCSRENSTNQPYLEIIYTIPPVLTVGTAAASSIVSGAATLNGSVTEDAGVTVDYVGFVWGTNSVPSNPGNVDPATSNAGYNLSYYKSASGNYGENPFNHPISGLAKSTTHYFRACAHNSSGWKYGEEVYFSTLAATHRISNLNTPGVRKGGVLLEGAKIFVVDLITETLTKAVTNAAGKFEIDTYGAGDVVPKLCAFCVWDDKAELQTNQGGNKDLLFKAIAVNAVSWWPGSVGNDLAVKYLAGGGAENFEWGNNGDALSISHSGGFVWTVGGGAATVSTAHPHAGTRGAKLAGHASTSSAHAPLTAVTRGYTILLWGYKPTATGDVYPLIHGNGTKGIMIKIDNAEKIWYRRADGTWVDTGTTITADAHFSLEARDIDFSAGTYDLYRNGTKIGSAIAMYTTAGYANIIQVHNMDIDTNNHYWFDDIKLLPHVTVEVSSPDTIVVVTGVGAATASEIRALIENHAEAILLMTVVEAPGQDGSGIVEPMAKNNLSGGMYYSDVAHNFVTPTEIA